MRSAYFGVTTSPAPRDVWAAAVRDDLSAMVFATPGWNDAVCSLGRHEDASRLYVTRDGRTLVVPLVRRRAVGSALSSLMSTPNGWGVSGIVAPDGLRGDDVRAVLEDLRSDRAMSVEVKPGPFDAALWAAAAGSFRASRHVTHVLDLAGGPGQVWTGRFPGALRTKIRKAEKSGLEIECALGGALLDEFYAVYLRWIDDRAQVRRVPLPVARYLGRKREPIEKFRAVARALGEGFEVWVARFGGEAVAAALVVGEGQHAFYWRAASVKASAGPLRANELLQWRMIEHAASRGARWYHMGESGGVASLEAFKRGFGAEAYSFASYRRERVPTDRLKGSTAALARAFEGRVLAHARPAAS